MSRRKADPNPLLEPIEIYVRSLSNFAWIAGLTEDVAEELLVGAEDCYIQDMRHWSCGASDRLPRHVVAPRAFDNRDVIYCEDCGQVDVGV